MKPLVLDVETTIFNKGNPFDQRNKCVVVGVKYPTWDSVVYYSEKFDYIQNVINRAGILVGFNIKFDLHWLRKIGIDISKVKVWDCQLAEFILNNQKTPYPSLNDAALKYDLEPKIDIVKNEYWEKGIDTDMIPREVLTKYLNQDLILTEQVYEQQVKIFKTDKRYQLFRLQCQDLLVLEEMEWNGIKYNTKKAREKASELEKELATITNELSGEIGGVPFNPNSNDHISCILYGGDIVETIRIPVGVFKTGEKVGETRYKKLEKKYTLPRLVEPIKGTEVKKGGYWEVNDTVLRKLKLNKQAKRIVNLLTLYAGKDKLRSTYLTGWSDLIDKMHWEPDTLHGTINQCRVITGRTSSEKPNLQNPDPQTKTYCESRYGL
jgi:DNA polymerase I-like protein with 3'-5' exonuclease and polymerase domains